MNEFYLKKKYKALLFYLTNYINKTVCWFIKIERKGNKLVPEENLNDK